MRVLKILLLKIYSGATCFELDSLNTLTMIFGNVLLCKPKSEATHVFHRMLVTVLHNIHVSEEKKVLHCNDLE